MIDTAPANFGKVNSTLLADRIAKLVQALGMAPATFYGCCSAGLTVLSLLTGHSEIVRNGIVHEAAFLDEFGLPEVAEAQFGLSSLDDEVIVGICKDLFRNKRN